MTYLPYHCPIFRTGHLLEPCKTNLARVKALKEAKKHIGPLEKCLECKGKMLETKLRTVIEGLPAPESRVEKKFVDGPPEEAFKPYQQDWDPVPEVTTAPVFLKDVGKMSHAADAATYLEPEMRKLSPEKIRKTREVVQRMAERYKKPPKQEEEIVPAIKITEKEAVKLGIIASAPGIIAPAPPPEAPLGARYCPTHPKVIQHIDKLGRWMGMCDECLSIRGKKCGEANFERGVTAPPMSIPLNLPKYAELKAWLRAEAEENERTMTQQIMFILKMAWRQGL